jgi:proteasome alpha subunit
MGGQADTVTNSLREHHQPEASLADAVAAAVAALQAGVGNGAADRTLTADSLEVAVLDRTRPRRLFKRVIGAQLAELLSGS